MMFFLTYIKLLYLYTYEEQYPLSLIYFLHGMIISAVLAIQLGYEYLITQLLHEEYATWFFNEFVYILAC